MDTIETVSLKSAVLGVCFYILEIVLQNLKCILSSSVKLCTPTIFAQYVSIGTTFQSNSCYYVL